MNCTNDEDAARLLAEEELRVANFPAGRSPTVAHPLHTEQEYLYYGTWQPPQDREHVSADDPPEFWCWFFILVSIVLLIIILVTFLVYMPSQEDDGY